MSQGIFISYRRDDTRLIAGRLYQALKTAFPKKKIFFDVDIPEPGNEIIDVEEDLFLRKRSEGTRLNSSH